jgi:hypothetical protein
MLSIIADKISSIFVHERMQKFMVTGMKDKVPKISIIKHQHMHSRIIKMFIYY